MAFKDRRRTDERDQIQGRPMWFTSDLIDVADVEAGVTLLKSFEQANATFLIDACILEVATDLDAGTVNIGHGTLPTPYTAESGTLTTTTADSLWPTATGDETTGTIKSWYDMSAAPIILDGAETTVPVIIATIATAVSGKFRVHFRVTELPQTS